MCFKFERYCAKVRLKVYCMYVAGVKLSAAILSNDKKLKKKSSYG